MKEKDLRLIETYEEKVMIEALQTGSKWPRTIIYLDLGIYPARFQIKKNKLNFLHYILNQHEQNLLFRFFQAHMDSPTKGDWVSEVKKWILEYEIATSFEEVKKIKKNIYEKNRW